MDDAPQTPETPPPEPESGSLADHEAQFRVKGRHAPIESTPPRPEAPAEPAAPPPTESTEGERDEKGRFVTGRHRAKSQQATPADVPRIAELTKRLRETEAERDALRGRSVATAPSPAVAPASVPPLPIAATPKPTPDQFTDYSEYVEALTDWKTDQKFAAADAKRQATERETQAATEKAKLTQSWTERVQAATTKYPDFAAVALEAPTRIPPGSLIDAWILEHAAGADVLYYLQQHPDEVTDLLAKPILAQAETLTLLTQRLITPPSRVPAARTGSVATPVLTLAPRPPNPVRTGPITAGDEPPGDEGTLADHERAFAIKRRR